MRKEVSQTARRVKVERGIYMRPGTSPAVYEICWTENGRLCWRTIEGGLREARAARGDAVAKLARGERVARTKLTFAEYAETWIETQSQRRPKTVRTYRDHLRLHILPRLGRRKLASITVDDVAALLADLQRTGYVARVLGHKNPAVTLATYSHVFAKVEHEERFRELQEQAFGDVLAAVGPGKRLERSDRKRGATDDSAGGGKPALLSEIENSRN